MAGPAAKIAELEAALRSVERERDELATDVERLCLQSGSSMFDPTYLLTERLHSAENEVKQHRQQVSTLKDERDALIEKLQQARTGKALIEQCAAELSDRCKSLERDALFYKERAVKAMGERDQEFENMRAEGARTQTLLGELRASLELALGDRKALEARLQLIQEELENVRKQQPAINDVAEAEFLQLRDSVRHLEDTTQKLKVNNESHAWRSPRDMWGSVSSLQQNQRGLWVRRGMWNAMIKASAETVTLKPTTLRTSPAMCDGMMSMAIYSRFRCAP